MKRISFNSISTISTLGVDPWESGVSVNRFGVGSNFGQKISGDRLEHWQVRKIKDENLADLLNVLLTALQLKKPSGRCRWQAIPTQR
ncbi:hypothetical protein [Gloeocapsopsis dulcis]|uniref:Uncharacterized protein n=1 Tax=Gloeocapsopsis dulcis AAB1 = 1H9 TaxID=1433147 RepID=A0A6N8FW47_9CHRO|nr:hypothetical protein [Gloeocapsopsis dulcis]MUL36166.1 hypothetical protein [Gloeocapsopsis dulcis AAB1 = 1H9]WNN91359.1 hypothetical protein P0S91_09920 [Gloeocapsopsis dulcis]